MKPNLTYKYDFQVAPTVAFFQDQKAEQGLLKLQKKLGRGYLRYRNDGIIEYTIGDRPSIRFILTKTLLFLVFKKKQARLMIKILDFSKKSSVCSRFCAVSTVN